MTAHDLVIDGSSGEGGGQILRTAVGLAAIARRPVRIEKIRAGRSKPGLGAQHLTAVRAVASACDAELSGDSLGSQTLLFRPRHPPRAGEYEFDVADAREGGSAGAATLVLQAVLPPLLLADGDSTVTVRGGTHMARSPPFDYLKDVWLSTVGCMGASIEMELRRSGWFPIGRGEICARVLALRSARLRSLQLTERGQIGMVTGRAIAAELPAHIAQRMADRATFRLRAAGLAAHIMPQCLRAACPGAGIFLTAEYDCVRSGFSALGRIGKPAEAVADEAVDALLQHHSSPAVVDEHLSDQLLVPFALSDRASALVVNKVTRHLRTNAWVIEQFGLAKVEMVCRGEGATLVTVTPSAAG